MWVPPDTTGLPPGYEQRDLNEALERRGLHPIASGQGHGGAVTIHQRDAVRLTGAGTPTLVAGGAGAEVLIWVTA